MPDAGGREQGGVRQRTGAHHDAWPIELARDCLEQSPVQAASHEFGAEPHEGGALGRGLAGGKPAEPAEARAVVQRLREPHVRELVPGREQYGPEQRQRQPTRLTLGRGRDARKQAVQLRPVHQDRYLVQLRATAGLGHAYRQLLLPDPMPRHARPQPAPASMDSDRNASDQTTRAQVSLGPELK